MSARAQDYDPVCKPLQLGTLNPPKRPIDTGQGTASGEPCLAKGASGSGSDAQKAAHEMQNRVKNNFCAPALAPDQPSGPLTPTLVDFSTFMALRNATRKFKARGIHWGSRNALPSDRSRLKDLSGFGVDVGEGDLVQLVAYVHDAGHSDVSLNPTANRPGGEAVNCNFPRCVDNDIHIALVDAPGKDECTSVTAEIVPHFRPRVWELFDSPDFAPFLKTHPVKITGQLFFDSSHTPCTGTEKRKANKAQGIKADPSGGNPARMTVWEIHPVYSIFVCKSPKLNQCEAADATAWRPFDEMPDIVGIQLSAIRPGVLKGSTRKCPNEQ